MQDSKRPVARGRRDTPTPCMAYSMSRAVKHVLHMLTVSIRVTACTVATCNYQYQPTDGEAALHLSLQHRQRHMANVVQQPLGVEAAA